MQELKQEYKDKIKQIKNGLIDKNANLNNKIGLIGSDAERLMQIKKLLIEYKKDLLFFEKFRNKL
jgi:hypothetical protein